MNSLTLFERRFRITTGLILATYVILHLTNHSLGLFSYDAMEAMRKVITPFWRSWFGATLLYGSLIFHFLMGLLSIYRRRTLRIPPWELAQLTFGLLLIPFLAGHIAATFGTRIFLDADLTYKTVLTYMFSDPWFVVRQVLLLTIVTTHVMIGLHCFFRLFANYRATMRYVYPIALFLPVIALLSLTRVSMDLGLWQKSAPASSQYGDYSSNNSDDYSNDYGTAKEEAKPSTGSGYAADYGSGGTADYGMKPKSTYGSDYSSGYGSNNSSTALGSAPVLSAEDRLRNRDIFQYSILATFWGLFLIVFIGRWVRRQFRDRTSNWSVRHSNGQTVTGEPGQTILEALRDGNIPHASICGGRGRCTTCRVRIAQSSRAGLHEPTPLEKLALQRIAAEKGVRLACQARPSKAVHVTPLVQASLNPEKMHASTMADCEEREVVAMFVDLRDSTSLAEQRLPFDILFILNLFMKEMTDAIKLNHGHCAHFAGDGIMVLFGLEGSIKTGCQQALEAAVEMKKRLNKINADLAGELNSPLRMGIGIHCGEAIVGMMGAPETMSLTAIGDNINTASRLESTAGILGKELIISQRVEKYCDCDLSQYQSKFVDLKGKSQQIEIRLIDEIETLERCLKKTVPIAAE